MKTGIDGKREREAFFLITLASCLSVIFTHWHWDWHPSQDSQRPKWTNRGGCGRIKLRTQPTDTQFAFRLQRALSLAVESASWEWIELDAKMKGKDWGIYKWVWLRKKKKKWCETTCSKRPPQDDAGGQRPADLNGSPNTPTHSHSHNHWTAFGSRQLHGCLSPPLKIS